MTKNILFFLLLTLPLFSRDYFVENGATQIFCHESGDGDPLLFIHGGPGLGQDYLLPYLENFNDHHRVIFYDQRGSGKSIGPINEDSISMENFIQDIEAIRKHLGLKKITLIGHSFGGFVAMHYAISHPQRLNKLILLNPMPSNFENLAPFIHHYREKIDAQKVNDLREHGEIAESYEYIFQFFCYRPEDALKIHFSSSKEKFDKGESSAEIIRKKYFFSPFDLTLDLNKMPVLTLVVHGDHDLIPQKASEDTAKSFPNAQFKLMKNCGHFPYVENFDELKNIIEEFL